MSVPPCYYSGCEKRKYVIATKRHKKRKRKEPVGCAMQTKQLTINERIQMMKDVVMRLRLKRLWDVMGHQGATPSRGPTWFDSRYFVMIEAVVIQQGSMDICTKTYYLRVGLTRVNSGYLGLSWAISG